jgi:hypothetical protein
MAAATITATTVSAAGLVPADNRMAVKLDTVPCVLDMGKVQKRLEGGECEPSPTFRQMHENTAAGDLHQLCVHDDAG